MKYKVGDKVAFIPYGREECMVMERNPREEHNPRYTIINNQGRMYENVLEDDLVYLYRTERRKVYDVRNNRKRNACN